MAWRMMINGVDRTSSIRQADGVHIDLLLNERKTASFTTNNGYIPGLREEVLIYDTNGVDLLFGGIVFERKTKGRGLLTFVDVECVDWSIYLSWVTISHTFSGAVTLRSVLEFIVTFLTGYGITLDPAQVTGPSVDATGYTWTSKPVDACLRDVTQYMGGYTWSITPARVLSMVLHTAAPAAPFSIVDAGSNVEEIDWSEDSSEYATRVTVLAGGTGTREISQTWTVTPTDISNGYLQTTAPSIPTGGVSLTVNGTPRTIGGPGSNFIWNWLTHRITAGTMGASVSDVFVLTYTAQLPFPITADSGATPPVEIVVEAPDITTYPSGLALATALLARYNQTPRKFKINTSRAGLRAGQALTINLSGRSTGAQVALIHSVRITLISDGFWRHSVEAVTGIYQNSPLDYFRALGGVPPPSTFTVGVNPATVTAAAAGVFLGGSRNQSIAPTSTVYTPVVDYVEFFAPAAFTATVRADIWVRSTGTVTARLYDITAAASVGNSSAISATTPTAVSFAATLVAGNRYRLELLPSVANTGVYGIGSLGVV